jgi:hypothetical protein
MMTTTKPKFKNEVAVKEIETTDKTTQGDRFYKYYATRDFAVHAHYNNVYTFKKDEATWVQPHKGGFGLFDGYGLIMDKIEIDGVETETDVIPAEWITRREFCTVREYKTTVWEII